MGLDMFLFRGKNDTTNLDEMEEVKYWRKANQIHGYIIEKTGADPKFNCNDDPIIITRDFASGMLNDFQKALQNKELAPSIVPTTEGFFFGSTLYDDDYFVDLQDTCELLEELIPDMNWEEEHLVYTCWW